jgi:uncharacterized protein (TIGR03435 family)
MRVSAAAVLLLCLSLPGVPQTFEAASVKPAKGMPPEALWSRHIAPSPAGLTIRAHTLGDCIEWAWGLKSYQLTGPAWMGSERYDIEAKASGPTPPERLRLMLQALLTERFGLVFHREKREQAVYVLAAGKGGPRLPAAQTDASGMTKLPGPGLRLSFQGTTPGQLADFLSSLAAIDRPVLDGSGLEGKYDFTLDLRAAAGPWPSEAEREAAPSVSSVLEQQLGLRLDARKQPVEVLVIDRARRTPSGN